MGSESLGNGLTKDSDFALETGRELRLIETCANNGTGFPQQYSFGYRIHSTAYMSSTPLTTLC